MKTMVLALCVFGITSLAAPAPPPYANTTTIANNTLAANGTVLTNNTTLANGTMTLNNTKLAKPTRLARATNIARRATTNTTPFVAANTTTPTAANTTAPITASATNNCLSASSACEGQFTHYAGSLLSNHNGSCNTHIDTNTTMQVALPHAYLNDTGFLNPLCGRTVTVINPANNRTAQATVADLCATCDDRHIDATNLLFEAITGYSVGRDDPAKDPGNIEGIQWFLN